MELDSSVLNIEAYRNKKQLQGEENARKLYELAFHFTERNANIREKVRAKHLFRQIMGLEKDTVLPPKYENAFAEWFLFDYTTIQGSTMFNLFLKKNVQKLSEAELIQGALFLTSVWEPVQLLSVDPHTKELHIEEPYTNLGVRVHAELEDFSKIPLNGYYLLRRIPIIKRDLLIGTIFPLEDYKLIEEKSRFFTEEASEGSSWRTYLKRHAIGFISKR